MGARDTQKRGVVRQACKASRSAAFGLRPGTGAAQVHRQTKGGFVNSGHAGSMGPRPVSLGLVQVAPVSTGRPRKFLAALPHRPAGQSNAAVRTGYPTPRISPVPTPAEARAITTRMGIAANGQAPRPTKGRSAPRPRKTLGDQVVAGVHAARRNGGERPPISVGAEPLDRDPPARQQASQRHARGFACGKVTTQA